MWFGREQIPPRELARASENLPFATKLALRQNSAKQWLDKIDLSRQNLRLRQNSRVKGSRQNSAFATKLALRQNSTKTAGWTKFTFHDKIALATK